MLYLNGLRVSKQGIVAMQIEECLKPASPTITSVSSSKHTSSTIYTHHSQSPLLHNSFASLTYQ